MFVTDSFTMFPDDGFPSDYEFHFTMDNISGSTLIDESANSHDGTITGATAVSGFDGNALRFDGSGDRVIIPSSNNFSVSEYAIAVRIKTSASSIGVFVLRDSGAPNGERYFQFRMDANGTLRAIIFDSSNNNQQVATTGTVNDAAYHKCILNVTSTDIEIYLDGSLDNSAALTLTPNVAANVEPILLGAGNTGSGSFNIELNADMDDPYFFTRSLTLAEIQNY